MSSVQYDGFMPDEIGVKGEAKKGCVVASNLFGIFFALLFKHTFNSATDRIYVHSRFDGNLYNVARMKAKTKMKEIIIRDMLYAEDAAISTHSEEELSCVLFSFTINPRKTVMGHGTPGLPGPIKGPQMKVVHQFTSVPISQKTYLSTRTTKNAPKKQSPLSPDYPRRCGEQECDHHKQGPVLSALISTVTSLG